MLITGALLARAYIEDLEASGIHFTGQVNASPSITQGRFMKNNLVEDHHMADKTPQGRFINNCPVDSPSINKSTQEQFVDTDSTDNPSITYGKTRGRFITNCLVDSPSIHNYSMQGRFTKDCELLSRCIALLSNTATSNEASPDDNSQQELVSALAELQASNLLNQRISLPEKTLFIGFAETATGIAHSLFRCFDNAAYIHTTRETVETLTPSHVFREEHSHAVEHTLFLDETFSLDDFDRIVLIDDELTTGKTALNLIRALSTHRCRFGLISILDWRSNEMLHELENTFPTSGMLVASSLIKGTMNQVEIIGTVPSDVWVDLFPLPTCHSQDFFVRDIWKMQATARKGMSSINQSQLEGLMEEVAKKLLQKRTSGKLLCLGTEEFIFIPCFISSKLGDEVAFHSTTRSPILPASLPGCSYPIRQKYRFSSPNDTNRTNYVYNIPNNEYAQAFLFLEKPISEEDKQKFSSLFFSLGISDTLFIHWY